VEVCWRPGFTRAQPPRGGPSHPPRRLHVRGQWVAGISARLSLSQPPLLCLLLPLLALCRMLLLAG